MLLSTRDSVSSWPIISFMLSASRPMQSSALFAPTYTYADDELVFPKGQTVRLRMRVRYTNYKRFGSKVRIIEEGEPDAVVPEKRRP